MYVKCTESKYGTYMESNDENEEEIKNKETSL